MPLNSTAALPSGEPSRRVRFAPAARDGEATPSSSA
jgi:hypothetical protein